MVACRACGLQPEDAGMHVARGRALEVLEEYAAAEAAFFSALSRDPDHAAAQVPEPINPPCPCVRIVSGQGQILA